MGFPTCQQPRHLCRHEAWSSSQIATTSKSQDRFGKFWGWNILNSPRYDMVQIQISTNMCTSNSFFPFEALSKEEAYELPIPTRNICLLKQIFKCLLSSRSCSACCRRTAAAWRLNSEMLNNFASQDLLVWRWGLLFSYENLLPQHSSFKASWSNLP